MRTIPTAPQEPTGQRTKRLAKVRNLSKTCEQAAAVQFIDKNLAGCALVVHDIFTSQDDLHWLQGWHLAGRTRRQRGKALGDPSFKTHGLTHYGICSLVAYALGMAGLPLSTLLGDTVMGNNRSPVRRD